MTEPRRAARWRELWSCNDRGAHPTGAMLTPQLTVCLRTDVQGLPTLLERERQMRRDEVAIDLEDRVSKKGTPPTASEQGDIRQLHRGRGTNTEPSREMLTDT